MDCQANQLVLPLSEAPTRPLPAYQVRVSPRAKHVSIKVSWQGSVEVVIPPGFDHREIPDILQRRQGWIHKTIDRFAADRKSLSPELIEDRPTQIVLRSPKESWQVNYQGATGDRLWIRQTKSKQVIVSGGIADVVACQAALRSWLSRKAIAEFTPWFQKVSQEVNLTFNKLSIRGQKTRWGSCSTQKNINLNYKLLFLPESLVRYVFIHELCHTVHMNHSKTFWQLVGDKDPNYQHWRNELKQAWRYVPRWVDGCL